MRGPAGLGQDEPPAAFAEVARHAGLDRYVATLDRDEPLPTLGELVRSDRRLVVLAEQDADGSVPWYLDGFAFVQDTPLRATTPEQLSCRRYRGTADSPLLMLNHWAEAFLRKDVILARAERCARERRQPVNLIAVDHYDQGELIAAVEELNRLPRSRRAHKVAPWRPPRTSPTSRRSTSTARSSAHPRSRTPRASPTVRSRSWRATASRSS